MKSQIRDGPKFLGWPVIGLLSAAVVGMFLFTSNAWAGKGDTAENKVPTVTQVMLTEPTGIDANTYFDITGTNFRIYEDGIPVEDATVSLPGMPSVLNVGTVTDELISASYPGPILAGDYLMNVSHSKGTFGYELTIGAIGPQGPKGDPGDLGSQGPKGDKGDDGSNGEDGANCWEGIPGGSSTADCIGPAGLRGPQGDAGDKGDKGDQGDPGPQGEPGTSVLPNCEAGQFVMWDGNAWVCSAPINIACPCEELFNMVETSTLGWKDITCNDTAPPSVTVTAEDNGQEHSFMGVTMAVDEAGCYAGLGFHNSDSFWFIYRGNFSDDHSLLEQELCFAQLVSSWCTT